MADHPARTLVLGIGPSGEILQCGRNAPGVIGRAPEDVVGAAVAELCAAEGKETMTALLDALGAQQERTAVLGVLDGDGGTRNAVVTVARCTRARPGPRAC